MISLPSNFPIQISRSKELPPWQNQQNGIRPVWSESLLCAVQGTKLYSCRQWWLIRLGRLIWVFAGRTCHFVGFVVRQFWYFDIRMYAIQFSYMWTLPDHPGGSGNAAQLPHSREWDRTSRMWKYNKKKQKQFFFFFFSRPSFLRICMVIMAICCWKAIKS